MGDSAGSLGEGRGGAAVAPTSTPFYTTGSFLPERTMLGVQPTVLGAPTPGLILITETLAQFLGKQHGGPRSQCFCIRGDFAPQGTPANVWKPLLVVTMGVGEMGRCTRSLLLL